MTSRRTGIALAQVLAILLAAAGLLVVVLVVLPESDSEPVALISSRSCLECHADVAAEWEKSHHAFAFQNPEVRKLSNDFQNEECLACHAPRPVLDFQPGERVLARQSDRGMGVDCLGCHTASGVEGVVTANPAPNAKAPCRPRFEPRLASVEYCGSCHNQHGTVDQWRESPEHLKGSGCLDCHMPEVWREGGRRGRDHTLLAAHDLSMLRSAVEVDGGWDAEGPWASVENVGAAHNFPTDERSRAADVEVRWKLEGDSEWTEWQHVWRFRDPYRDELDLTNTQLPSEETWRETLAAPAGAVAGEVRLVYKTNPLPDAVGEELYRVPLEP